MCIFYHINNFNSIVFVKLSVVFYKKFMITRNKTKGVPRIMLPEMLKRFKGISIPIIEPYLLTIKRAALPVKAPIKKEKSFF